MARMLPAVSIFCSGWHSAEGWTGKASEPTAENALHRDGCSLTSARALACLLVAALVLARLERSVAPLELLESQLPALLPD